MKGIILFREIRIATIHYSLSIVYMREYFILNINSKLLEFIKNNPRDLKDPYFKTLHY